MKNRAFKSLAAAVLTIAALTAGQRAWADPIVGVGVSIFGYTNGSTYAYVVSSSAGALYRRGPINGTEKRFDARDSDAQFHIGGNGITSDLNMTLDGTLLFANSNSATDVTTGNGSFKIVFVSEDYYIADAAVTTQAGATVDGCTISGRRTKTLTVTIPSNTTFRTISLSIATHTPLDYCTISGIEESYIDDGVNQPVPTVTLEGTVLRQDVDYTLSWSQGTSTGSVTVTGAGDYVGSNYLRYDIREPNLSDLHSLGTDIYEIASQQDLDYLARIVNGKGVGSTSNACSGKTFRQTADIAYSNNSDWDEIGTFDSNFTPVGIYGRSFRGTYDGQGYTISGVRVHKGETGDDARSLGLFGYLGDGGTVKNVVLSDANIVGIQDIGGLVGYSNGTVTDCFLYHVRVYAINVPNSMSIIVGNQGDTFTRTHYRDCCDYILKFGAGRNNYKSSVFSLTTEANVTLPTRTGGNMPGTSGIALYEDGITLGGTQYYSAGVSVTLTYSGTVPTGYWPRFTATCGSTDITDTNINGSTLTMPDADVSVTYDKNLPVVTYLDGDGIGQQCSGYTPITSSNDSVELGASGTTRWYVVASDATISGQLKINGDNVHLILCDGASLNISNDGTTISTTGNLTIHGQQQGTGTLNTESTRSSSAIYSDGDVTILGGRIIATSASGNGITADSGKTITLGWTSPANSIYAYTGSNTSAAYYCTTLKVKDGQTLWNGSETLSGEITDMTKVNGKKLTPYTNAGETTRTLTVHQASFAGQVRYWATFYHPYWNFQLPAGAQAFTMGTDHALYRVGDGSVIPADCAVVIMAESASIDPSIAITLTKTEATATPEAGNILEGTITATDKPGVHVMSKSGTSFGFFEYTGTDPIPANKAYYE